MKVIQFSQPGVLECLERPRPGSPQASQARVRTRRMGICGTDYSIYRGKFPFFEYPRIPGHELGVEVLEVGADVTNVKPGDLCSVEPYMNCGSCIACRKGRGNCCVALKVIGVMTDGGLCEEFLIRADKLHPSSKLSLEDLALVETLAIGCHAVNRGQLVAGDHVLIIGAGPIGLAVLEFARLKDVTITVMDLSAERLEFCRQNYGIRHTIQPPQNSDDLAAMRTITDGELYSVVFDATGHPASMSNAISYVAQAGQLVYVGITTEQICFKHPTLHRPEVTLMASRNALPNDFTQIIELIEAGTINTGRWITHRTTFDRVREDFPIYLDPSSGVIKAMINFDD